MKPRRLLGKSATLSVLRAVTKLVAGLSEEELDAFVAGEATLTLSFGTNGPNRTEKTSYRSATVGFDPERLQKELKRVESTEAGLSLLSDAALSRAELERMARSLELPIMKEDSASRLEEKIVQALVASRLNSRAVRGK
jgi:hypothetical protein